MKAIATCIVTGIYIVDWLCTNALLAGRNIIYWTLMAYNSVDMPCYVGDTDCVISALI